MRRLVILVLLALATAGCSGGSDGGDGGSRSASDSPAVSPSPSSASNPLAGTWDARSVVDRTTLKGKGNTKGSKDRLTLVLGCADSSCGLLMMRGSTISGALSRTIRLTTSGTGAEGTRTRRGPCTQTANDTKPGSFTETSVYRFSPAGDRLRGGVDYTFKGCGFDGRSHLALTGTRTDEAPPYLPTDAAASLAGPVTAYDTEVGRLYAGYNGCFNKAPAKTAACLVGLLEPWARTFPATEQALAAASGGGPVCTKALREVDLAALQRKTSSTVQALRGPKTQQTALNKTVPQLVSLLTTTHQELVTTLALCVDPQQTDGLGRNGVLSMDVDRRLPVPTS